MQAQRVETDQIVIRNNVSVNNDGNLDASQQAMYDLVTTDFPNMLILVEEQYYKTRRFGTLQQFKEAFNPDGDPNPDWGKETPINHMCFFIHEIKE